MISWMLEPHHEEHELKYPAKMKGFRICKILSWDFQAVGFYHWEGKQ